MQGFYKKDLIFFGIIPVKPSGCQACQSQKAPRSSKVPIQELECHSGLDYVAPIIVDNKQNYLKECDVLTLHVSGAMI